MTVASHLCRGMMRWHGTWGYNETSFQQPLLTLLHRPAVLNLQSSAWWSASKGYFDLLRIRAHKQANFCNFSWHDFQWWSVTERQIFKWSSSLKRLRTAAIALLDSSTNTDTHGLLYWQLIWYSWCSFFHPHAVQSLWQHLIKHGHMASRSPSLFACLYLLLAFITDLLSSFATWGLWKAFDKPHFVK